MSFGKLGVVSPAFHPAVAPRHYDKLSDRAGFYGGDYFVGEREHLIMRKASRYRACFDLGGRRTLFRLSDNR